MSEIRGIEEKHEHSAQKLARDTRPLGVRFAEFISQPAATFVICGSGMACVFIFPIVADLVFLTCFALFMFAYTRKHTLPFRLPATSDALDYNDPIPGSFKPRNANGISFFGNDRITREELWFTNDDLRTHILIFGSTGSGKTESLISIAFNSLIHGSGFIYIDGKGDNSLFSKVFSMVRSIGRDDDLLLINFMTGARDIVGPQESRLSNTMNPFASGSSSMLSNLIVSLMDSGGGDSNGDMWKGRAINFVESLIKILAHMRDKGHLLLDANSIRDYFLLDRLEQMVVDKEFPLINSEKTIDLSDVPPVIMDPIRNYVINLPGYNPRNKGRQAGEVLEQHGFITMQLTRVFGSLADTYGHILRTNLAEVDLKDVVLNRRILLVLLPALEKSPDELSNLGKVIIASLKAMMAAGLGDAVEGDYRDVVLSKPTTSPSPYVCIMDEYGYYAVKGFAVVPAQARSLGFSAVFAGQDLPAFQKASKEEAASIGANCNIKICMKLEDPQETFEFFNKVAGETYVTNVSGFQQTAGSMSLNYLDTKSASVDRRARIDLLDLRDQREGQCHIFFKSKIIRAEMFYANPKPPRKMRIGHFLKVESPLDNKLISLEKRLRSVKNVLNDKNFKVPELDENEDIRVITETLNSLGQMKEFERGVAALITLLENEVSKQKELSAPYEDSELTNVMSAYTKIEVTDMVRKMIGEQNVDLFSLPLIRRGNTLEELKHVQRLCGSTLEQASVHAMNLISDIESLTTFPPDFDISLDKGKFLTSLNSVLEMLGHPPYDVFGTISNMEDDDTFDDIHLDDLPELPEFPDFPELPPLPPELADLEYDDDDD